jgi:Glyoxalase-like domain
MTAIDGVMHTTAMAREYERLLGPLQRLFGAVVLHDTVSDEPAVGRRGGMVWLGDNSIEIGAPVGDRSPVRRFVDEWGGGMHSLALSVEDADATRSRLADLGVQPAAFVSDDIFFTRPGDTAGLLLEWSAMFTDDDPRAGARLAMLPVPPVVDVQQYAFVSGVVADPATVATRLAELFGTDVVRLVPDAPPDRIAAIVSLVDCLLVLFPLPPPDGTDLLWGGSVTRSRFHGHGLRVPDLAAASAALAVEGVDVVAEVEGMALLDPTALPIPTFLCQELLPEDPRHTTPEAT